MRWLDSVKGLEVGPAQVQPNWLMRHPPGADRLILGASWNADGHCLAATTNGLEYFDGSNWSRLPTDTAFAGRRVNNVRRLCPTTWVVSVDGGRLVEVAREGTTVIAESNDPAIDFIDVDGDLEDFAVVLGQAKGRAPLLCTRIGRRWLLPHEVFETTHLSGLARVDDERWLVIGRDLKGQAWAGLYRPLGLEVTPIATPIARALLACASRRSRGIAVAVGGDGSILCLSAQGVGMSAVQGQPDLSVVSLDVAGQFWAGSVGKLHFSPHPLTVVDCVWQDPSWRVPFVSLHAEVGHLLALTVDGGVIEGRTLGFSSHG
jgi:hypothetical protein